METSKAHAYAIFARRLNPNRLGKAGAVGYGGPMPALQGGTPERLCAALPELTLLEARKVVSAVHRGVSVAGHVRQVRRPSLERVRASCELPALTVVREDQSSIDP